MKLEGLSNIHIKNKGKTNEENVKIIPLGYIGSEDLAKAGEERLKENGFYYLKDDGWHPNASGWLPEIFYGIEERDFHLFKAYDHLEGDGDMIGYGNNSLIESGYEYFFYDVRVNEFFKSRHQNLSPDQIYARRKREEKPSDELELPDVSPDIMYIPLKTAAYEKLKNISSKEGKAIPEKISEWLNAKEAQEKTKRSRAEVMKDIKKELEDAWSEEEAPGEMVKGAEFLLDLITEGGMKFK